MPCEAEPKVRNSPCRVGLHRGDRRAPPLRGRGILVLRIDGGYLGGVIRARSNDGFLPTYVGEHCEICATRGGVGGGPPCGVLLLGVMGVPLMSMRWRLSVAVEVAGLRVVVGQAFGKGVAEMSSGPIEFMGEPEDRTVPATEYGGGDGLIQGDSGVLARGDGMPLKHELDASEIRDVMTRRANVPIEVTVANEREVMAAMDAEGIVDPVTGRALSDDDKNVDVTGRPGREHGLRDGMIQ
jgi:hypothetical protein